MMAWTAPRTWVSGELVTAALFNTHIRDNLQAIVASTGAYANAVTGPHVIGGSSDDFTRLKLDGSFTSGGASSRVTGLRTTGALTGATGDTTATEGAYFDTSITTQASETIGRCTQVTIGEPDITVGSGATVTASASLYISGAASEATTNNAIWVDDGDVQFDADLRVTSQVLIGGATSGGTIPLGIATNQTTDIPCVDIANATSATYNQGIHYMLANIGTNHATGLAVGKAHSAKNDATFGYKHASDGSDSNYAFIGGHSNDDALKVFMSGAVNVPGAFSKGSGSFRIPHPLPAKSETHALVHSFVESPETMLLYRGQVTLVDGSAVLDMNDIAGMTTGTWDLLCREEIVFATNLTGWSPVRGSVSGCTLTLECQDATSTDTVAFLVTANRHDEHIMDTDWTDEEGRPIVEPELPEVEEDDEE